MVSPNKLTGRERQKGKNKRTEVLFIKSPRKETLRKGRKRWEKLETTVRRRSEECWAGTCPKARLTIISPVTQPYKGETAADGAGFPADPVAHAKRVASPVSASSFLQRSST